MGNSFMQNLQNATNYTYTENGALAHRTTNSAVYDMFATGGAYRRRSIEDCILLFKNAYEEDKNLALKCLFYLRDCRGGQGERRFFRAGFHWLCYTEPEVAKTLLPQVSEYGRWDDLIYTAYETPVWNDALAIVIAQLKLDTQCKTPSLLGKWMPSENASSKETRRVASAIRTKLNFTHKEYRKMLSSLRDKIKVVEKLMSQNRWEEIEFDKLPSKAGIIYKNAFARRDILAKKYEKFAKDTTTKVNADTLFPYEIVHKAVECRYNYRELSDTDRAMLEKYWTNLPDYLQDEPCKLMCVVDTSASMRANRADAPINVAIALGMYCAERIGGPFKNNYISFSSRPQLIKVEGVDFVDKVRRIYNTNLCDNTNLLAAFKLIEKCALQSSPEDIPDTLVVISDMQIDRGVNWNDPWGTGAATEMEKLRVEWAAKGLKLPKLVYWNVDARGDANFLDDGPFVTYVSGASPTIFKSVLTGKTGYSLMLEVLLGKRYEAIQL